jgi:putative endonuclease
LSRETLFHTIPAKAGTHLSEPQMFFVYLLASKPHGTLYVGFTSDLLKRVWEHKNKLVPGFTERYGVHRLVWFEAHESHAAALKREKQIKEWRRGWKRELIEKDNPYWVDLYPGLSL